MKKIMTDLDYVEYYADKLRGDNRYFKQQKELIESQMHSSSATFKKMLSKQNFKSDARKYLKSINLLN